MKHNLEISIFEITGSPLCVASGDGQKIYDRLAAAFKAKRPVTLSFLNVTIMTSAFLNAAIGQLYGNFKEAEIKALLHVKDLQDDDKILLKRVIETAKQYFADPQKFNNIIDENNRDES